jgi:hypothetical protein
MSSISLPPEVAAPTLEELELDQYIISGRPFKTLLENRQHYKQMIDDAEKYIQEIDTEIGASLDLKGVRTVIWNTDENKKYLIIRREASAPRSILDRTLLLSAGVTPMQLQAGTKLGKPGKSGITVKSMAKKDDEVFEN